jgi:hypothetical protein
MHVARWVGLVIGLFFLGRVGSGNAQSLGGPAVTPKLQRSFDLQLFHPAVGARSFLTLDSADVLEHMQLHVGLVTHYSTGGFSYSITIPPGVDYTLRANTVEVVRHLATAEWVAALGLYERFEVGVALPYSYYLEGDNYDEYGRITGETSTMRGLGDLRVEGKSYLTSFGYERALVLGASLGLTLPTGDEKNFLGEKSVTGRGRLLLEYSPSDSFRALVMVGGLVREKSEFLGIPLTHALLYGAAVEFRMLEEVALLGELSGRYASKYVDTNTAEMDAGMRFSLPAMFNLLMGAGVGVNRGIGSPSVRAFVGLGYAPDFRDRDRDGFIDVADRCPDEAEDRDGFEDTDGCPELDNDFDQVLDAADRCPNDPEDLDRFQDEDGCPDADNDQDTLLDLKDACPNEKEDGKGKRPMDGCPSSIEDVDGDGIVDGVDQCVDEPEDKDGFQDVDGCPDIDNDGDGIPDAYDLCPNAAEDLDGFEDNDGCGEVDNDRDGVPDGKDKCPTQAETLNGNRDDDGCADSGAELVRLLPRSDRIWLREPIRFSLEPNGTFRIQVESELTLGLVARVLIANPELAKIRIDVRGEEMSKDVALECAQMIVAFLMKQGVEPLRLKPSALLPGPNRVDIVIETRAMPKTQPIPLPSSVHGGTTMPAGN